jgi:hypothetical protein
MPIPWKSSLHFLLKVKLSDRPAFPEQTSVEARAKAGRSGDTSGALYGCNFSYYTLFIYHSDTVSTWYLGCHLPSSPQHHVDIV